MVGLIQALYLAAITRFADRFYLENGQATELKGEITLSL